MVMHMLDDRRTAAYSNGASYTICGRKSGDLGEGEPCAACQKTAVSRRNARRQQHLRVAQAAVLERHAAAVARKYNAACEAEGLDPEHEEVRGA